jgi:hypothetical protein
MNNVLATMWVVAITHGMVHAAPRAAASVDDELIAMLEQTLGAGVPAATPTSASRRAAAEAIAGLRKRLEGPDGSGEDGLAHTAVRCALGVLYSHRGEWSRAQLDLAACEQPRVAQPLQDLGRGALIVTDKALRRSDLCPVDIATTPPGWIAVVEAFPQAPFLTPHTVWLPDGSHRLRLARTRAALARNGRDVVVRQVIAHDGKRGAVFVEAPALPATTAGVGFVDVSAEAVLDPPHAGAPPAEPHRSILSQRYRRGIAALAAPVDQGEPRSGVTMQFGIGQLWPAQSTAATITRLALHGHSAVNHHIAVEVGVDWSHRFAAGSASMRSQTFGALLGGRLGMWPPIQLSLLIALRGRLEGSEALRGGARLQVEGRPVPRWPLRLGAALDIERRQRAASVLLAIEFWAR